jgi:D-arabinose 1-dehydrogenase-like Zn-dependent alcohol dehydrogenase
MKALLFPGDHQVIVADVPTPEPGPGEVRVAMRAAAVCGSDLHGFRAPAAARAATGQDKIIPGHEPAGVVDAVGPGVRHVAVGDRVGVYHYRGCGHCAECRGGRLKWCDQRRGYGGPIDGSDADYLITDEQNCLPLPDDMSFVTGALLMCVGGTAFRALAKLGLRWGDSLAVYGLGPVGLAALRCASAMGIRVIGVDPSEERRAIAGGIGAWKVVDGGDHAVAEQILELTGGGACGSLETSGSLAGRRTAVRAAAHRGRLVCVGSAMQMPRSIPPISSTGN